MLLESGFRGPAGELEDWWWRANIQMEDAGLSGMEHLWMKDTQFWLLHIPTTETSRHEWAVALTDVSVLTACRLCSVPLKLLLSSQTQSSCVLPQNPLWVQVLQRLSMTPSLPLSQPSLRPPRIIFMLHHRSTSFFPFHFPWFHEHFSTFFTPSCIFVAKHFSTLNLEMIYYNYFSASNNFQHAYTIFFLVKYWNRNKIY